MANGKPCEPLIVGIGNPFRTDDGVGPWVAQALKAKGFNAEVHEADGTGLITYFERYDDIIMVDATKSGKPPGSLLHLNATQAPLPINVFQCSTHRIGLAEAVEIARALGMLPPRLRIYGIEGASFAAGYGLSDDVEQAAAALAVQLANAITPVNLGSEGPSE